MPRWGQGRGGRPWRRKRDAVLARDKYLCQPCLRKGRYTQATQVDHIESLALGGTDEASNLQAICDDCHKVKTQQENGNFREKQAIGTDGWPIE